MYNLVKLSYLNFRYVRFPSLSGHNTTEDVSRSISYISIDIAPEII